MNLKRLWDTENKKMVWAIPTWDPHKKLQVWTNDDWSKLYIYTTKWVELDQTSMDVSEYGPVWKELDDETVGYYLTNVPTELYNWDEGDEVSYTFKDYDWTVLKSGKVDKGTAPTPPADPTRETDAQYTYTFAWWNPTVGNISKKTVYTATYTTTVNKYTVNIFVNDSDMGYTEPWIINNVPYGTPITENEDHTVSVWEVTVTPYASEGYVFSSWWELPTSVTWATSITATFVEEAPWE